MNMGKLKSKADEFEMKRHVDHHDDKECNVHTVINCYNTSFIPMISNTFNKLYTIKASNRR